MGGAAESISWRPVPGKHALALVDDAGKTVAKVAFQVRGNALAQLN